MVILPQNVTTWVGQSAYFECIPGGRYKLITASPTYNLHSFFFFFSNVSSRRVSWSPMSEMGRMSPGGFRMTLVVGPESGGIYTCTINGIGSYSATLTLIGM